jgi:hypothetical protein
MKRYIMRTYSEIVWLEASWTASTKANANRTTGLPNSYHHASTGPFATTLLALRKGAPITLATKKHGGDIHGGHSARGQPQDSDRGKGNRGRTLKRLASGPRIYLTAAIMATVALVVPTAFSYFKDHIGPDVRIVATEDDSGVPDFSSALPQALATTSAAASAAPKAIKVGVQGVKLAIYGNRSTSLVIVGMSAHIFRRSPALSGTLLSAKNQGGGNIQIGFNLGSQYPVARVAQNGAGLVDTYFSEESEALTRGQPTIFQVVAYPERYTYYWGINVQLLVNGRRETKIVQDSNGPFKLTGYATHYKDVYVYEMGNNNGWKATDPTNFCRSLNSPCKASTR